MINIEHKHEDVYGATFAMYDKNEMIRFIEPFRIRFERNGLDANAIFEGKKCLDAGCGNGRGSIFMAMHGAAEIHALDISPLNIQSTQRNAKSFGYDNIINTVESSLEDISFGDAEFDFVWCNGVLMHCHNPDKCLKEISRVLKHNGQAWIYVYGAGGVYWYCVTKFRELLKEYSESECLTVMKLAQIPVSFTAEYMDDWKAPYLRKYTQEDFSTRLKELGFTNIENLPYATDYDTSHRINTFPEDRQYLGEGDLRYLLNKKDKVSGDNHKISCTEDGSEYVYPESYKSILDNKFSKLANVLEDSLVGKILAFAYIQRNLRDNILLVNKPFDFDKLLHVFDEAIAYSESIAWK